MTRHLLDARAMEHPEPLERAIAILRNLDTDAYLYMLHRREPIPLLALDNEHSLNALSRCSENEEWHILITPNSEVDLEKLLDLTLSEESLEASV